MRVGIASSIWRGIADLPFDDYLAWAKRAGAETAEVERHATGAVPTPARGVHHFSLAVKSFEAGQRFYGDLLGIPRVSSEGFGRSMVVFYQCPTGQQLHPHLHGPSTQTHLAIDVDDFDGNVIEITAHRSWRAARLVGDG